MKLCEQKMQAKNTNPDQFPTQNPKLNHTHDQKIQNKMKKEELT